MKIINSSHEFWERPGTDELDILRFIERVGRVCYKSEDKITDNSAEKFVGHLINRKHGAVLEHASLMFRMSLDTFATVKKEVGYLEHICGFKCFLRFTANMHDEYGIISGNVRAWRDFIDANVEWVGVIPAYTYSVIHDYPRLFPEYASGVDRGVANLFRYFVLRASVIKLSKRLSSKESGISITSGLHNSNTFEEVHCIMHFLPRC